MSTEILSPEDQFEATVKAMSETAPAQPEQAEAPQETTQEAVPRDEQGRFAPREGDAQAAPQEAQEPFEGFSTLPPDAQEKFRRMMERADRAERERNSFRDRFSRANQIAEQLRRQQSASQGSGRQSPQPSQGSGRQAQPGIAQARADVANMPAGAERNEANRQLDAWEKHAREYPEDAAAIQQLVQGFRDDVLAKIGPQLEELQRMRGELESFRSVAERFQSAEMQRANQEAQSTLDEIDPRWRWAAGWVDDNGSEVPREQRQWSGAMQAWLEGHDPEVRNFKLQQLSHASPYVAGQVFREFFDDLDAVSGQHQTQAPNPVAARRAENLRDVAPGGGRNGGSAPVWRQHSTPEDDFDAAAQFVESRRRK